MHTRLDSQIEPGCAAFDAGIGQQSRDAVALETLQALCASLKDRHPLGLRTNFNDQRSQTFIHKNSALIKNAPP